MISDYIGELHCFYLAIFLFVPKTVRYKRVIYYQARTLITRLYIYVQFQPSNLEQCMMNLIAF